ncbi:5-(carboxyamino)imidazole ribonucleotide synthase [Halalkalibacillus halophilus]|uniref:5-(carboxyamino)imidazole ribonucleotide synthase n=1 Tax=Halalkalibacillus halophilus TaxID=392827 RepID=UPI0004284532|nr:5-(carboxyamino)imidazole ribonucleotide synthase [Halalkalibacillus halophilus]
MVKRILPGSTIGIVGGGQLGRMLALKAKEMGYKIAVLDPTENSPTGQVADTEIVASYDDLQAAQRLQEISDVITYEFENIDAETLEWLVRNAYVPQGSKVIPTTQDRATEKKALEESGARVATYELVYELEDLKKAVKHIGYPCIIKTRRFGYDGKGQLTLTDDRDLDEAATILQQGPCIIEQMVNFAKEISVIVTRSVLGEVKTFPVAWNIHRNHILHQSVVPAQVHEIVEARARKLAVSIAEHLDVVGTLGVEMFLTEADELYVNEVAPRPHNSGHFTQNACVTDQFEQHIRAITGFSLGETKLYSEVVMVNILGQHIDPLLNGIADSPKAKVHLYGKAEAKQNRKMGHVNFLGNNFSTINKEIEKMNIWG